MNGVKWVPKKSIYKVNYYDQIEKTLGPDITIKAFSMREALEIAEYRASKRVAYCVGNIKFEDKALVI